MAERIIQYSDAIAEALDQEMARDPRVHKIGEDVGIYGGAYQASKGLFAKWGGERVKDTPISEGALMGIAAGMARLGLRPVYEVMYVDFAYLILDQLVHSAAFMPYMTDGLARVPLVVRTEGGTGRNVSGTHSKSLEALFTMIPGVQTVMPYTPADAKGLLKTAIRDDNVVVSIEHKMLYKDKGDVPEDPDFTVPLGEAYTRRQGDDITIVSYSRMVGRCDEAAEELGNQGVNANVIDLRSLVPLDIETVAESVGKTGKLLLVSEAWKKGNYMHDVQSEFEEHIFKEDGRPGWDYLDTPVKILAGENVVMPMNPPQEDVAIPSVEDIVENSLRMVGK